MYNVLLLLKRYGGSDLMTDKGKSAGFALWNKEISKFKDKKSKYEWDELEELITDAFEDEKITSDEFDELMEQLMEQEM